MNAFTLICRSVGPGCQLNSMHFGRVHVDTKEKSLESAQMLLDAASFLSEAPRKRSDLDNFMKLISHCTVLG